MSSRTLLAIALGVALAWGAGYNPSAQSAPLSRAEVKAETRTAEKAGTLTPAGQGPFVEVPRTSEKTRAQRKSETLAARKAGTLVPAGDASAYRADQRLRAQPTIVSRADRKAETRAAEKAGTLIPAGEGPAAPRK